MREAIRHFDLFSGFGGFAQAGKRAYEDNTKRQHLGEKSEPEERKQGRLRTTNEQREMLRPADRTASLFNRYDSKNNNRHATNKQTAKEGVRCESNQSSRSSGLGNGRGKYADDNSKSERMDSIDREANGRSEGDQERNDSEGQGLVSEKEQGTGSQDGRHSKLHDDRPDQGAFITIGFSEIDQYANKVLAKRFPGVKNYGDITKINWDEIPDFDMLTGGSPCQDLSIAGKRAGLEGSRSGLFWEFMRAVREKKPRYFIWENVKGALSSQNGWDFAAVINEMAETGYSLWWQVLNAKDFGVPQNRERIFVVGFRDEPAPEILLEPGSNSNSLEEITRNVSDAQRVYTTRCAKSIKALGGGMGAKTGLYATNPKTDAGGMRKADGHTGQLDEIGLSDTQRYKLCGNGIVVEVAEQVIRQVILKQYEPTKKES